MTSFWVDRDENKAEGSDMTEYPGDKTRTVQLCESGLNPVYSMAEVPTDEYVRWLEDRLEKARGRVRTLCRQVESYDSMRSTDDQDYLEYEEDDRRC